MSSIYDWIEYIVVSGVFVATIGESYAHLIPDRFLPPVLLRKSFKQRAARWSAALLVLISFVAIPLAVLKSSETSEDRAAIGAAFESLRAQLGVTLHRRLTDKQAKLILEHAADKELRVTIVPDFFSPWASDDVTEYAVQLASLLKSKADVTVLVAKPPLHRKDHGLLVAIDKLNQRAVTFLDALRSAGLDVTDISDREEPPQGTGVMIIVARNGKADVSRVETWQR